MRTLVMLLVCGCAATTPSESTTALSGLPPPAAEAMRREAGGATIERVGREGNELYEGQWYVDGRLHEVTITATGQIVEREEELAADQVPQPVRVAAIAALPRGAAKLVFVRLLTGNYEAEAIVDGKEYEVTLSSTGQVVTDADDDDEDEDDEAGDDD